MTVLLTTRLFAPPPPTALMQRPRLMDRLKQATSSRLTLLSAPAGSGKTTLLSAWRMTLPAEHYAPVWLTLDSADNDPIQFWSYVVEVLEAACPGVKGAVSGLLNSSPPVAGEAIVTTLINACVAYGDGKEVMFILDDYHVITEETLHQALAFLLDHLPAHLHLIIATRVDPSLPLARLRVRGQIIELSAAELAFSTEEAFTFLHEIMGLALTVEEAAQLVARTEGWIAGLQAAALALRENPNVPAFLQAFTGKHRYVLDFLAQEVLEHQPEPVQHFLLLTSILKRLSAEVCDAVTGRADSHDLLARLDSANLFLVPLDQERHWYRYHMLFRAFLYARLAQKEPEHINTLHQRAASWYEQQGMIADAIEHALAAADSGRAARLIAGIARPLWMRGEWKTLLHWLERLPEDAIRAEPELDLFYAWTLIANGQLRLADQRLDTLEHGLWLPTQQTGITSSKRTPGTPPPLSRIVVELNILRATIARIHEDAPRTITLSLQALKHLAEEDAFFRAIILLNLGHAYRLQGQVDAAIDAFSKSILYGQEIQNIHTVLLARSSLVELYFARGALHDAGQLLRETRQFAARHGVQHLLLMSLISIKEGELLYEWNRLAEAEQRIVEGIELGKQYGGAASRYLARGYLALVRVLQVQGDEEGVERNLALVEELIQQPGHASLRSQMIATQVRLPLTEQRLTIVGRWAAGSDLSREDTPPVQRERDYLTLVRVLLAQHKTRQVMPLLRRLRQAAEAGGRTGTVIEALLLEALTCQAQQRRQQALSKLGRALFLAESEGYCRLFLDEGTALLPLLAELANENQEERLGAGNQVSSAYISSLLLALGQMQATGTSSDASKRMQVSESLHLVQPLSERERVVLRYLASGLSNQAIARMMMIELSTVKSHLKHIYRKLNVANRLQAARRARELNIC